MTTRPAAFLDRDGTLIVDVGYVGRPEQVQVIDGVAGALRLLHDAGIPAVVITNQSGIARGFFTESDYERVRARLDAILAVEGVRVDASYHCPHHPDIGGACSCRKPGTLLHRRAASDLGLDPARSLFVGDRWRDVEPAITLGGRGILVPSPVTPSDEHELAVRRAETAHTLRQAIERWLSTLPGTR